RKGSVRTSRRLPNNARLKKQRRSVRLSRKRRNNAQLKKRKRSVRPSRRLPNNARPKKRKHSVRLNRRLPNNARLKKQRRSVRPSRKRLKRKLRHRHLRHAVRIFTSTATALGTYMSVVSKWGNLSAISGAMLPTGQVLPEARGLMSTTPLLSVPSYSPMHGLTAPGAKVM